MEHLKFKVGDRVRIKDSSSFGWWQDCINREHIIVRIGSSVERPYVLSCTDMYHWREDQLELVEPEASNNDILKQLAERNGTQQDIFVLEEMSELQKELTKHRRGKDNRAEIIDECTDVLLSIFILLMAYDASEEEINKLADYKLHRLRDFIKTTKEE